MANKFYFYPPIQCDISISLHQYIEIRNTTKSYQNYFVSEIDGLLNIYPALNMEKTNFHEQIIKCKHIIMIDSLCLT